MDELCAKFFASLEIVISAAGKASISDLWNALDESQRADFEKALADGRLGNMVAIWEPWWSKKEVSVNRTRLAWLPTQLVYFAPTLDADGISVESEVHFDFPIKQAQRPQLTAKGIKWGDVAGPRHQPAKELPFNLVDLLFAYAYTICAFNGDVDDPEDAFDASICAAQLSSVLSKNAVHSSVAAALTDCRHNALEVSYSISCRSWYLAWC
jgi:hypothetical protein